MALKQESKLIRSGRPAASQTISRSRSQLAGPVTADEGFLNACEDAMRMPRPKLLAVAIARGCRHYATLWQELKPADDRCLPHEVLGCALLRGPTDAETFQAIRVGAMVLSDLSNLPERIAVAADRLDVTGRVAHIARIGSAADDHREFWQRVLNSLPEASCADRDFLPGVSRLVVETRLNGPEGGPVRVWLRTEYRR